MMSIRIHIPTPMRPHTDNQAVVEAAGGTVKALLDNLGQKYPAISGRLFENGQVRRFINLYLNDEDVRYLDNLDTAVKDGDELSIIPAVAGG
jgi:molybdopterin synthase sulfur carrier subunit